MCCFSSFLLFFFFSFKQIVLVTPFLNTTCVQSMCLTQRAIVYAVGKLFGSSTLSENYLVCLRCLKTIWLSTLSENYLVCLRCLKTIWSTVQIYVVLLFLSYWKFTLYNVPLVWDYYYYLLIGVPCVIFVSALFYQP